jgi:hypothetical protein
MSTPQKSSITITSFLDKYCFFEDFVAPAEQLHEVKHDEFEPPMAITGNPFAGHKHTH